MKRLNNKGMTTVEILITFVIIVIIVVSMYASISSLKNKETIESYKESIVTYKNLLTKDIQDDLIINSLTGVEINDSNNKVTLTFKNGSKKVLEVISASSCENAGKELGDLCSNPGSIRYGDSDNMIDYPVPNLGSDKIDTASGGEKTVYSLKIYSVNINTTNNILNVKIQLYHPDLGTKYSINIVSPINYE